MRSPAHALAASAHRVGDALRNHRATRARFGLDRLAIARSSDDPLHLGEAVSRHNLAERGVGSRQSPPARPRTCRVARARAPRAAQQSAQTARPRSRPAPREVSSSATDSAEARPSGVGAANGITAAPDTIHGPIVSASPSVFGGPLNGSAGPLATALGSIVPPLRVRDGRVEAHGSLENEPRREQERRHARAARDHRGLRRHELGGLRSRRARPPALIGQIRSRRLVEGQDRRARYSHRHRHLDRRGLGGAVVRREGLDRDRAHGARRAAIASRSTSAGGPSTRTRPASRAARHPLFRRDLPSPREHDELAIRVDHQRVAAERDLRRERSAPRREHLRVDRR